MGVMVVIPVEILVLVFGTEVVAVMVLVTVGMLRKDCMYCIR